MALAFGLCPIAAYAGQEDVGQDDRVSNETQIEAPLTEKELSTQQKGLNDEPTLKGQAADEASVLDETGNLTDSGNPDEAGAVAGDLKSVEQPLMVASDAPPTDISQAMVMTLGVAYTGSDIHPDLQLACNGKALVEGADYEIVGYKDASGASVAAPKEMGTYAATVRGLGSYSGKVDKWFQVISVGGFADADIDFNNAVVYTGSEAYPDFKVTLDGAALVLGTDYTITAVTQHDPTAGSKAATPIEKGTYNVTLTGVESRGYSGQQTVSFSIVDAGDIAGVDIPALEDRFKVTSKPIKYEWTGSVISPSFTVLSADGKTLTQGTDYSVEYLKSGMPVTDLVDEGTYVIHITGQGAYSGSTYPGQVQIVKPEHDIAQAIVSGFDIRYYYTGETVAAEPKVTIGSTTLTEGTDYSIQVFRAANAQVVWALPDIVYPAHYYVRVLGRGNYIGSKITEFYVIDKAASDAMTPEKVTDSSTGVVIEGTLFEEMNVDGNEVRVGVGDVAKDNPTRNTELLNAYKATASTYFKVFDVSLDLFDVEGELVASLTEKLGSLSLALPVDPARNGQTATIIHLHKNADGITEETRLESKVVNGVVTVVVDRLSEFVIGISDKAPTGSETTAETKLQTEQTGTTVTKASASKSTLPATGDSMPLVGLLVVMVIAAGVSLVALRREIS